MMAVCSSVSRALPMLTASRADTAFGSPPGHRQSLISSTETFSPRRVSSILMIFSLKHEMLEIAGLDQIGQGQPWGEPPVFWTDDFSSILPLIRP